MKGYEGYVFMTFLERWKKMPDEVRRQSAVDIMVVMKRLEHEQEQMKKKQEQEEKKQEQKYKQTESRTKMDKYIRAMQRG